MDNLIRKMETQRVKRHTTDIKCYKSVKNAFDVLISRPNKKETTSDFEDTSIETCQSEMQRKMITKREL